MKRSSFSILYYIRESRIKKDGTAGIEVKITINGERCFFSTGKNIKVENWDKVKHKADHVKVPDYFCKMVILLQPFEKHLLYLQCLI